MRYFPAGVNIYKILEDEFARRADKAAIETVDGERLTFAGLDSGVARMAGLLASLGLEEGARVAAYVEKSVPALLLYLATVRAGYVYLPLNTAYRSAEVDYFFTDAEPEVIVCDPEFEEDVRASADRVGTRHLFTLDAHGNGSLMEASAAQPDTFATKQRADDDLAAILYTSGTTGRSKGAMLSHGNLSSNALVLREFWGWTDEDVLLHMLPVFHVHGLFVAAQGALLAGATMLWSPKFSGETALQLLPRATVMMGVPTFYVRLLADPRLNKELCRNMRLFVSGSAPLLLETFNGFRGRTGHTILERYGMSETGMLVSNPWHDGPSARIGGTVGVPLPGVSVRVVGDNGAPVAPGEIGAIQVKGPNVFCGYWRMPEKTQEEFTADGWFKTGDLGRWGGEIEGQSVPENYLTIVGRGKDLVISGGFNVYPKEVEGFLNELEGVGESAVIGVPHPDFGEAVVAVVVPGPGARPDPESLIAAMKARVANFKVPKKIHFVDALPRNAMGKVQKNLLREKFPAL